MSASVGEGSGQDVDLNLAPIIDCFTVLITYLLITASFINLAAMDVGVSATGSAAPPDQPQGPPPMIMTMLLSEGGRMTLTVSGGDLRSDMIVAVEPLSNGSWNLNELSGRLAQIQKKWPQIKDVSVSAEPTVKYKDIVNVINETQRTLPKVFVSG